MISDDPSHIKLRSSSASESSGMGTALECGVCVRQRSSLSLRKLNAGSLAKHRHFFFVIRIRIPQTLWYIGKDVGEEAKIPRSMTHDLHLYKKGKS